MKQLDEITTLCDVEACTLIYSDFDPQPVVWPSMDEVRRLITKYQSFPKVDQGKRKVNQEIFTRQRLQKIQEKLRRQERENHRNEMTRIMFQSMMNPQHAMSGLNTEEDFKELARVISQNLMEVNRMMDSSSFNPPTHGGFGSCMAPNMTCPLPAMEFPPPYNMGFEHPNTGFETSYMNFQPPNLEFQPANMEVQPLQSDFQQNNMPYNDPNMEFQPLPSDFPQNGMPYPSNPPPFPHYHNEDMGPHDPSSH
ncbi:agamous-like MADS-box protein AGL80 [Impatiens glandulifera]|uniref:agamous-like MADS-box protein AGL80 n=1 Tax=Impatiens glandulifera TaxID=253017 RepID=UPI001FB0F46D|nr:agamous-like MADS-box protein AGL80 [Impatiens glandulifera]